MDEAKDCAKQALRTGPVGKEQTSGVHSKRALVNFSTKHKLESKILLTASQTPRMGRERPRHTISNPNKTLAFRVSIPSMHQGIFAWKINCMKIFAKFWGVKNACGFGTAWGQKGINDRIFLFLAELFLSQFCIACSPLCSEMALWFWAPNVKSIARPCVCFNNNCLTCFQRAGLLYYQAVQQFQLWKLKGYKKPISEQQPTKRFVLICNFIADLRLIACL